MTDVWPGIALLGMGAVHGLNPGMGWLFAVALGCQEGSARAVWRALPPLALGHALAVAAALLVAAMLGLVVPVNTLKVVVALTLLAVGGWHLARHRHPRWAGMRVTRWDLTVWSFLMASAHGAGLMVLPVTLAGSDAGAHAHHGHAAAATAQQASVIAGLAPEQWSAMAAALVHTAGYLLLTGLLALLVYQKLGLRFLRSAWINVDLLWAGALVVTAVVVLAA